MRTINHLVDAVALYITQRENSPGTFWFSKIVLKYAYSQIPIVPFQNTVTLVSSVAEQQERIDS